LAAFSVFRPDNPPAEAPARRHWVIDTSPRPGYPYFVRGRVDSEPEAGDSMPREKRNFLYLTKSSQSTKTQAGAGTDATTRTLSASTNGGSFYVYSVTGMLLAEYSRQNQPIKDYIYVGGRLIAEYKPQESRTYFYTPDQINSTRVVTDESGTVVYSAAHDPYGGIQQTWANTFDPTPKFSGKERDSESGLDYFGARYYDRAQYRFLSVDPVIPVGAALPDPQLWNLYGYCRGNPINYLDPDGRQTINIKRYRYGTDATYGTYTVVLGDKVISGYTLEPAMGVGKGPIPCCTYIAEMYWWASKGYEVLYLDDDDVPYFDEVFVHRGNLPEHTTACILVGKTPMIGEIGNSKKALDEILFEFRNYRANEIEKEIFLGVNDLEYMSWLCRGQVQVTISNDTSKPPAGIVTYTVKIVN